MINDPSVQHGKWIETACLAYLRQMLQRGGVLQSQDIKQFPIEINGLPVDSPPYEKTRHYGSG